MVCVQVSVTDFKKAAVGIITSAPKDPRQWTFNKCVPFPLLVSHLLF